MSFWFIIPLGIFIGAAYLFKQSSDEMAYLAAALAILCLLTTLCLAPWPIQLFLLIVIIVSNSQRNNSSSQSIIQPSLSEKNSVKLVYRGVNYNQHSTELKVTENEVIGRYRGQELRVHHLVNPPTPSTLSTLKYRGVVVSDQTSQSLIPLVQEEEIKHQQD